MTNEKAIKVAELKAGETGRGIVRLDPELMDILGIRVGDIVQIDGNRKTVAKVLRGAPEDANRGIIRMDGSTRRNAGVALDERVAIKKVAANTYIITPYSVDIMGDLIDELENNGLYF